MNFFQALKNQLFPKNKHFTGVLLDTRSESEKERDFAHEEIAGASAVVVYRTKAEILPITEKYFKENQKQTSSCVAHGDTLALGIDNELEGNGYVRLSKAVYYHYRPNFPGEGMNGYDAGNIAVKKAAPRYETLPTPDTEFQMNNIVITPAMELEAKQYRAKNFVTIINCNDIDTLVSISNTGKAVPIFIYSSYREWAQEYPDTLDNTTQGNATVRHCITILPHSAFIENGEKHVAVQDSAWFGDLKIRYLSGDFIRARVYSGRYFINLENTPVTEKPNHLFTKTLKHGMQSEEVRWLQKCLQYEGLFPANVQPTGLFAGLTLKAVKDYQLKYADEILDPAGLFEPTGIVATFTNRRLNKSFSV